MKVLKKMKEYTAAIIRTWYHIGRHFWNGIAVSKVECCYPNSYHLQTNTTQLPNLFDNNPDLKLAFIQYTRSNLSELSVEVMHTWIHDVALPHLLVTRRQEMQQDDYNFNDLLTENRLSKLHPTTVYHWMKLLGFKFHLRKNLLRWQPRQIRKRHI